MLAFTNTVLYYARTITTKKENQMIKKIPEFLLEMSNELNKQDNRMTADPLFEVRYKDYLVTECGYNESHYEIIDDEGEILYHSKKSLDYTDLAVYLYENYHEWRNNWAMIMKLKIVKSHLLSRFATALMIPLMSYPMI